ncbi:glycoside hydrolase family 32 protein [Microbacterium mangrovi]|nr:glycoside hydrolase family 32 protein [Microbacterium mangrovi]
MTHRPLIHFTPARHWMNDPNGLVFHEGRYHLFFQHNPWGIDHANMSWGHASSVDLVTWTEHPVAILADEHEQVYSGSVVVDVDDTAGFAGAGQTALVAIYTSLSTTTGIQSQSLAYSVDEGMTWTKYAGNPVLDRGSRDFRDPKVFRYDGPAGAYWVMVAVEADEHQVVFYRSDDLKDWTQLSSYGPAGAVGGVWECPDLFPLAVDGDPADERWVLVISLNPGGIAGGSGTQYVVGDFDGRCFVPDGPAPLAATSTDLAQLDWLDFGHDCYAGVTFSGLDRGRPLLIAWMNNWDYARAFPATTWRGAMTLARTLTLRTVDGRAQLCSAPVAPIGTEVMRVCGVDLAESVPEVAVPRVARVGLRARVAPGARLEVTLCSGGGEQVAALRYASGDRVVELDRALAPAADGDAGGMLPGVSRAVIPGEGDLFEATIILDLTGVEVFAAGGARAITDLVTRPVDRLMLGAHGPVRLERLTVHDLEGAQ